MKTVTFRFQKTGFNAHTATGKFTYDTEEHARQAAEHMKTLPGYSQVELV